MSNFLRSYSIGRVFVIWFVTGKMPTSLAIKTNMPKPSRGWSTMRVIAWPWGNRPSASF